MEKKPGFKECPRCGLRNKLASVQCDFCGWEFHEVSEDWSAQVKALDRIGHDVDSVVLDDELSKKIESTIVRIPREPLTPQPKPVLTVEEVATIEQEVELRTEGGKWSTEHVVKAEMPTADQREVEVFVDTMIGGPANEEVVVPMGGGPPQAVAAGSVSELEENHAKAAQTRSALASGFNDGLGLPIGIMGGGIVIYAIALTVYSQAAVGVVAGWAIAVFGAAVLTLGAYWFYQRRVASRKGKEEPVIGSWNGISNEVVICPKCNELVNESVPSCPSCGVRFDRS